MKKTEEFSWPLMFAVTGASFLIFSGLTKLLSGSLADVTLFFKIGIASSVFAVFSFLVGLIAKLPESNTAPVRLRKKEEQF